jgi:hypothetical protein
VNLELVQMAIPLLVPILVLIVKAILPKLPKAAPLLLAPILGAALDILTYYIGLGGWSPLTGALLGALGVFIREVVDQLKKAALGA